MHNLTRVSTGAARLLGFSTFFKNWTKESMDSVDCQLRLREIQMDVVLNWPQWQNCTYFSTKDELAE